MRRAGLVISLVALIGLVAAAPPPEFGRRGMVAADHRLASEAGALILEAGGNAADAAIAAALASGVVQPAGSGLGGGGFAVLVTPDGEQAVLDFREVAPAAATQSMFVDATAEDASRIGGLAVGVPGEPSGLVALHERWGSLPLRTIVRPAIQLAQGFAVGAHLASGLSLLGEVGPGLSLALFGQAAVPSRGERVRRIRLGRTLSAFSRSRGRDLTHGSIAADIADAVQDSGGVLTVADLSAYTPVEREPVVGTYRGWSVITMPPPSSGGVVLLQALSVLEGFELPSLGHGSADLFHLYAETFQHAFADRARYMGDPDRIDVPVDELLSVDRVSEIRRQIIPGRTFDRDHYGTAIDIGRDAGTLHISVLDGEGMAVALTTTINTGFGSQVVAPRSGVLMNNQMDDFVARPGVPNAYGLVGSAANAVAPGARPLSSMSPTVLISPDGARRIVVGASGGPFIITSTLQVIVNIIDFGFDPAEAVSAPRMHHQWAPEKLFIDAGVSPDTERALRGRGHEIYRMPFFSSVQVVVSEDGAGVTGASDPRKGGWPAGW
ncbi:MAG: gamma-glutamyltransferase [Myxococcota bacterium]|nr:gamma-glutamyltransferase [Myxococcota bacterium]